MRNQLVLVNRALTMVLLTIWILAGGVLPALAQEMRTWTDKSGQHRIEAEFVSEASGTVVLKREDGKRFEIALNLLSEADQKLIQELKTKLEAASPFRAMDAAASTGPGEPKVGSVDVAEAREVAAIPKSSTWQFDALPAVSPGGDARLNPLSFSSNGFKFEGIAVSVSRHHGLGADRDQRSGQSLVEGR